MGKLSNSQLVHTWAQQNRDGAQGGNISFRGRSLFSYRTEIARFIEGRVVYTSHTYSPTTSGKHLVHVPRATSHLETYRTGREIKDMPDTWSECAPVLLGEMVDGIRTQIDTTLRARTSQPFHVGELQRAAQRAVAFEEKYRGARVALANIDGITWPDVVAIADCPPGDLVALLAERWAEQLKIKIARAREESRAQRLARAEREARIARERAEREAFERLDLEEKIARWRAGDTAVRTLYGAPVMLRANGNTVQTSHGAEIPRAHAELLYRAIERGAPISGARVGAFTVQGYRGDDLIIGCHVIPMDEIHALARAIGLIETEGAQHG